MATLGKVANRYAKALFDELQGQKTASKTLAELSRFASVIKEHKELSMLIQSPGFSEGEKTGVIEDLVAKLKLSTQASQILISLARMGRIDQLPGIVTRLRVKLLTSEGIQPIHVVTADTLSAEDKKAIEEKFSKVLGGKVEASYDANPTLVGGLKVMAGGRTYDGTIAGWLDEMQERLVEGDI